MLIRGDNLLGLKALEQEFAGKVKCVYIDPPYNTGSAFEHYDDGVEHSIWLSLMRDRIELLRRLLSSDGSLWITVDDNEAHYLKVLCDEVFGRRNFVTNAIWQKKYTVANDAKWLSESHDTSLSTPAVSLMFFTQFPELQEADTTCPVIAEGCFLKSLQRLVFSFGIGRHSG
jgi:adenine specific DNA methylase Mod